MEDREDAEPGNKSKGADPAWVTCMLATYLLPRGITARRVADPLVLS